MSARFLAVLRPLRWQTRRLNVRLRVQSLGWSYRFQGRQSRPVARPGFKPGWGRHPFPGRFDSGCLPPLSWPDPDVVRSSLKRHLKSGRRTCGSGACPRSFWPSHDRLGGGVATHKLRFHRNLLHPARSAASARPLRPIRCGRSRGDSGPARITTPGSNSPPGRQSTTATAQRERS